MEASNEDDQGRGEANPTKQTAWSEKQRHQGGRRGVGNLPFLERQIGWLERSHCLGQMLINLRTGDLSLLLGLSKNMTPTGTCRECMEALDPKHLYSPDAAVCCSLSPHLTGNCSLFPKAGYDADSGGRGKDQGKGPTGCPF